MKGGFEFPTFVNTDRIYVIAHHAKAISKSLDYYINHFGIIAQFPARNFYFYFKYNILNTMY